jgi:hypothetical protein
MAAGHQFEHLPLILRGRGPARLGKPPDSAETTSENRENRAGHGRQLGANATEVSAAWQTRRADRMGQGLPAIAGIPLLLRIDPALDVDSLRHFFKFEIVSEEEDGFVIVASEDVSLAGFQQRLTDFARGATGSATVASIHELRQDPTQEERLRRILSEVLLNEWPTLVGDALYVVDVGIACVGDWQIRKKPKRGRLTDATWARKEAGWSRERAEAYDRWDALRETRVNDVSRIIGHYGTEILGNYHDAALDPAVLPDSFTLRLRIPGRGLKDLTLNYPYIFEVTEPDDIETPQQRRREEGEFAARLAIRAPAETAPTVCVIDSGIQEEHVLVAPGIHKASSRCFLPERATTDIADYVVDGGHGTRVAGAVLHGEQVTNQGQVELIAWIQNARILDDHCDLPDRVFPPTILRDVVKHYHEGARKTRIFNHSINANSPCRLVHMSAWAAEIDLLCNEYDILFVQSAGNLRDSQPAPFLGISELLVSGCRYPDFLGKAVCRVASPAQSLQALTVGSVAYGLYQDDGWRSFASRINDCSGFSRSGLGIWGSIKPEVVELGGDLMYTLGNPPTLGTPDVANAFYPELVRSTRHGGPAVARDGVGTSFAAPKVARLAARLQAILPNASCLLYRALIAQSARWPQWSDGLAPEEQAALLKRIGYGVPDAARATTNTDYRSTLISQEDQEMGAGECHIYQVPIPHELRHPGADYRVLVEVTLSYVAQPRRTRRSHRGYLSVWLDWKASREGESIEAFFTRALRDESDKVDEGRSFPWIVESRSDWGRLPGVHRNSGTLQKDWAVISSNELPENFCIAIRGHRGWSRDPEAVATYALTVSFESLGREIRIYEPLRTSILELQADLEAETETEVAIELED